MGLLYCVTLCYSKTMRATINISMPPAVKKNLDRMVKEENYASVSELFRDALRALEEERLYQSVMRSRKDVQDGKFKKLKSLKDLM